MLSTRAAGFFTDVHYISFSKTLNKRDEFICLKNSQYMLLHFIYKQSYCSGVFLTIGLDNLFTLSETMDMAFPKQTFMCHLWNNEQLETQGGSVVRLSPLGLWIQCVQIFHIVLVLVFIYEFPKGTLVSSHLKWTGEFTGWPWVGVLKHKFPAMALINMVCAFSDRQCEQTEKAVIRALEWLVLTPC